MNTTKKIRKYGIVIKCLAFLVLITIIFLQAKYYRENISNAKKQYGKYQIIVYDINNDLANDILKDGMFDNAEKFIQTYTRSDNGIINSIYTNSTYFDLSMNKILVGTFPKNKNEVMVDEICACKFGKSFSDSIKKNIIINDKTYTITGVITKEAEVISEETYTFVFCMEESPEFDTCSVILCSDLPIIYLLQKYIEAKYDTKNIMINSSFLEGTGFNSFGFPKSAEGIICLIILISVLFSVIIISLILKSNKKVLNILQITSIAVISISICLTSYGIEAIKYLYTDLSNFDYKLSVKDDGYGYKEDIESYLKSETMKYEISLFDIQYEYVNISLTRDCLSEKYIEHLRNLSTKNASQFSPYSRKIMTPVVIIYANQETMQEIIQDYDGTTLNGNECIAIQNIYSKHQSDFEFLVQEGETVTLRTIDNDGVLSTEELIIKKTYNNITLLSDDINLPVLFVSRDICNNYINSLQNRIIYFNRGTGMPESLKKDFSNLCGFSFVDLWETNKFYSEVESNLTYQKIGLIAILVLLLVSSILATNKQVINSNQHKRKTILVNFIIIVVYFFCCVIASYLIYRLSVETTVYYRYVVPIFDILLSILPLVFFLNIRTITMRYKQLR